MKTIVISDVHGRSDWKEIIKHADEYNKIVFLGDYFDSWDHSAMEQMKNFKQILDFKRENEGDVILLLGNHDLHYLLPTEQYSGYQDSHQMMIGMLLNDAKDDLQWAYEEDEYLFSHAGVTNTWCKNHNIDTENLVESINNTPLEAFGFQKGAKDRTGDDPVQSPCWVRPASLFKDGIQGHIYIVGHTQQPKIEIQLKPHNLLILTDAPNSGEYLTIENSAPIINKYKNKHGDSLQ